MTKEVADLFVGEDEDLDIDIPIHESDVSDTELVEVEDPVIELIPLVLNLLPDSSRQSLHVLQFNNRSKKRPFTVDSLATSVKTESNYIEVRVPLDTDKFYDELKQEEWGTKVVDHGLQGVLNPSDGGLYAAKIISDGISRKIVLLPVDSTTQLRPSFKYIDDLEHQRLGTRREPVDTKPTSVQILQTSAKTNNFNADGLASHLLGESLKHIRKFEAENWQKVNWRDTYDSATQELRETLVVPANEAPLQTSTTMDDYVTALTR